MKTHKHFLTLVHVSCTWLGASNAQAASPGSVGAWGENGYGQTAVPVAAQSGVTAIAAGNWHSVALKNEGSVVVWGWNARGQTDVPIEAQSGVRAVAAGGVHTVALKNDGSVLAWGDYFWGQTTVPVAAQSGVTAIAAGGFVLFMRPGEREVGHTVALKNDGTVVAWGNNDGNNDFGQTTVPEGLSGVTAIAAGGSHTVALIRTPVSLHARSSGNELVLSWLTNAVGFTLQSTRDLTPPLTWIDSTNPPAVLGARFTVTNTLSGSAQSYRLRKL